MSKTVVPKWDGPDGNSGCSNGKCPAGGNYTSVMSVNDIDGAFPTKKHLDWWPVVDGVTHVCTVCGFYYFGVTEAAKKRLHWSSDDEYDDEPPFTPEELGISEHLASGTEPPAMLMLTVSVLDNRDIEYDIADLEQFAYRYIRGLGDESTRDLIEHLKKRGEWPESNDITTQPMHEWM